MGVLLVRVFTLNVLVMDDTSSKLGDKVYIIYEGGRE